MSHFSKIKTRIVEREYLLSALEDLGYAYEVGQLEIKGFRENTETAEIRVQHANDYDIGFRLKGDRYELVADWWGISSITQKEFTNQLMQRYAYHAARAKLEAQGFDLVAEETGSRGSIRLVLRRTA
jgi:hypothetical protein